MRQIRDPVRHDLTKQSEDFEVIRGNRELATSASSMQDSSSAKRDRPKGTAGHLSQRAPMRQLRPEGF